MEDWEQDDFVPPKPVVHADRWEGEDEEDVKDNWDDEEEDKGDEKTIVAVQPKKKKSLAQVLAGKEEKKRQELEEKRKQIEEPDIPISPEDELSEKLMRQKLQEESDLELAKEAFGIDDDQSGIDTMHPKSKEEFDEFRKELVTKISKYETSPSYLVFIEELCRDLTLSLQPDDIKKITLSLNAISAEKIKAQKVAKGKKKAKTKASIHLGKDDLTIMDFGDEYEDFV